MKRASRFERWARRNFTFTSERNRTGKHYYYWDLAAAFNAGVRAGRKPKGIK